MELNLADSALTRNPNLAILCFMADRLLLSIIVASYTLERLTDISELLQSIKKQTYPNIETIFVIERSRELFETLTDYARKEPEARMAVVFASEPGLSAARNLGIKHARGDILSFVDDDVVLPATWAEEIVKTFDDSSIIGATGHAFPIWEDKKMSWFPREFYWIISCTAWFADDRDKKVREVRNAWGHCMAFRREAFESCLFADSFGRTEGAHALGKKGPVGDDTEFSINLRDKTGKTIVFNPAAKVGHKVYRFRLAPAFIRRQAYWQGYTKAMFKRLYGRTGTAGRRMLSTEYTLLRQILVGLPLEIVKDSFIHPFVAWRKLSLTITVLFHLTLGYFSVVFPPLARVTERVYR